MTLLHNPSSNDRIIINILVTNTINRKGLNFIQRNVIVTIFNLKIFTPNFDNFKHIDGSIQNSSRIPFDNVF